MTEIMPLRKAVVQITHEATPEDSEAIHKALKAWHNRIFNGSIPKTLVIRLGRQLYLDLDAWEDWLMKSKKKVDSRAPGRPRSK